MGYNKIANTASRDSQEVRKQLKERQAFFGLAKCQVEAERPILISTIAIIPILICIPIDKAHQANNSFALSQPSKP